MSDDFSPAERAYFESGGKDTSALEAEIASGGSQTGESPSPAAPTGHTEMPAGDPSQPQEEALGDDDGDEEVVVIGKDGNPRAKNGRFVPHQALHKERERRKATEAELLSYRDKMSRADERLAVLNQFLSLEGQQRAPQAQQQPQPVLDPNSPGFDPIAALNYTLTKIAALESHVTQDYQVRQQREQAQATVSSYQQEAYRYAQEKPEFPEAYKYLVTQMRRELEVSGVSDPRQRDQMIAAAEHEFVTNARRQGRSPAEAVHQLAVARGFAGMPAAPQQPPAAQRIEQIAKGQRQAGISLSAAGGSSGEGLTAAALADMNDEEFAATAARLGKAKLRQLMGG